jgi:hypothetical protein
MSIASQIMHAVDECTAVSLYSGYGVNADGSTVRFPVGVNELEKRNDNGRTTQARYVYADGSRLTFKWSDHAGASYSATGAAL